MTAPIGRLLAIAALLPGCSGPANLSIPIADAGSVPMEADTPACEIDLPLDERECLEVRALALPAMLPPAAGNRYADNIEAAQLGFLAFYDPRFSTLPETRCASCHLPEYGFVEQKAVSEVVPGKPLRRNSLSILNAAWAGPYYFWDGRADSLWSQPLFALEAADEMASSRLAVAHAIYDTLSYRTRYEQVFGALPDLGDTARYPSAGKPGEPAYDQMPPSDRQAIDRLFVNFGKALEAYVRKVATGPSDLDRFLAGDTSALDPSAQRGLTVFTEKRCIGCHSGPTLSDGKFHKVGGQASDRGRSDGIATLLASAFNASSVHWDDGVGERPTPASNGSEDDGAFRTPSLRNLPRTAPYGHDGRAATLEDFFTLPHGEALTESEQNDVMLFLLSLNGQYPQRPWSDWPAR